MAIIHDITHRSLELLVWEWIFGQFSSLDIIHRSLELVYILYVLSLYIRFRYYT